MTNEEALRVVEACKDFNWDNGTFPTQQPPDTMADQIYEAQRTALLAAWRQLGYGILPKVA